MWDESDPPWSVAVLQPHGGVGWQVEGAGGVAGLEARVAARAGRALAALIGFHVVSSENAGNEDGTTAGGEAGGIITYLICISG